LTFAFCLRVWFYDVEVPCSRPKVLTLIASLGALTYMDRLLISAAAPAISAEFGFTPTHMGYIFGAFALGYALFEIPAGWWGDTLGPRRALARIVLGWSLFTALTGAASGLFSFLGIRFLFGAGEAGAFPNIARAVANWFPLRERGRAMSASFLGLATGASFTAALVLQGVARQGWRTVFFEFGLLGVVWTAVWLWLFEDRPREIAGPVIEAPPEHVNGRDLLPGGKLYRPNLGWICAMYFAYGYSLYFYISWLPTYLLKGRGFSITSTGLFSALPWVFSGAGYMAGGWLTDRIGKTGNLKNARCGVGMFGYAASGMLLIIVATTPDRVTAAAVLAGASFFQALTVSPAWTVCLDVGHRRAGLVTGCMNTVGNLGGALAPVVTGRLVESTGSWNYPFYLMAAIFFIGAVIWTKVDPFDRVV
jgi:ACS family glucarate transporter-like MFS transporter